MIKARVKPSNPDANLRSYEETYRNFSWSEFENHFSWYGEDRMNIVIEAVDRWIGDPARAARPALVYEEAGLVRTFSFADLRKKSCQWADVLTEYGFEVGDRLVIYLPNGPTGYFAMIGCVRAGVVACPIYPNLTFDELDDIIRNAQPRGILTHPDLVENLPAEAVEGVENVFLIEGPVPSLFSGEILLGDLPQKMPEEFETRKVAPDAAAYMLYTSGSTGPPKGVVHTHYDMVGHLATAKYVLDLNEGTVLWTDGHPAWVTGTVYGIFAPWLCGATSIVQGDPFSASTWYRTLEKHHVEVFYSTPRTIRRLMEAGEDLPGRYDFSALRHIATVGAALDPELFYWVRKNLKLSPHDTWWMTETGMICIANYPSSEIKPGSMGRPVPGVTAAIIDETGEPLDMLTMGELALKPGWPAMMKEIRSDEARYEEYFRLPGWFLTGDMAIMDEDGYFYHQGRTDDLIKAGDKLVGPYEIERVLSRHPAVKEAAVISKEFESNKPGLKAFVTITRASSPSTRLNRELKAYVRANLSPDVVLAEVEFVRELPKTPSGKLLRRVLRAAELGLPSGDYVSMKD